MMNVTFDRHAPDSASRPRKIPVAVQILSILLFAAFAISTSIVAMVQFWPAGIALAVLFAWQWGRIPTLGGGIEAAVDAVKPASPGPGQRPSGNASFDAYRQNMLDRLEQEQGRFDDFLTRLREARDKTEFDRFMDDRAARLHDPNPIADQK